MGRKKRKLDFELKPFCYYCDREFGDEKVLLQHQKAKHFKCLLCDRKLDLASSLALHMMQVHKTVLKAVPNSLPKRSNPELCIRGMNGVPTELIEDNLNKLKQKINALNVKKQQKENNAVKRQKMPVNDMPYYPYGSAPNFFSVPYIYTDQQLGMMSYPESYQNTLNIPKNFNGEKIPSTNIAITESTGNYLNPLSDMNLLNKGCFPENDQQNSSENIERKKQVNSVIDIEKEKHVNSVIQKDLSLNETYLSKSISNDELTKSEEKITLNLMDPLNIFEELPFKLPMFPSSADKIKTSENINMSASHLLKRDTQNKMENQMNPMKQKNITSESSTAAFADVCNNTDTPRSDAVTNNVESPGISFGPQHLMYPPVSTSSPSAPVTLKNVSLTSLRRAPFIPPPPKTKPNNLHLQSSSFLPTSSQLPTLSRPSYVASSSRSMPIPATATNSPAPPMTPIASLPAAPTTPPLLPSTATTTVAPLGAPYLLSSVASTNMTSATTPAELSTVPAFPNANMFQSFLSQDLSGMSVMPSVNSGVINEQTSYPNIDQMKEVSSINGKELNRKDMETFCFNNSKAKTIRLNIPPPTMKTSSLIKGLILFYDEADSVYQVKAMREFGFT